MLLSGMAIWPLTAQAQQAGKLYRIGLLSGGSPAGPLDERNKSITLVLAQRGFIEGRNVVIEQRWANGRVELLDALAAELNADKVDVIVAFGYPAALAAKVSAPKTPTVISGDGDPVATGLVDGLARPGGYLTGVTELSTDLSAKRLEILKDAEPARCCRDVVERGRPRHDVALSCCRRCRPRAWRQSANLRAQ